MRQLDEIKDVQNAPSRYVDTAGDTMTSNLKFVNSLTGIEWEMHTDGASIKFKNDADNDTNSYLEFKTMDNGDEYFKFVSVGGNATNELMSIKSDGVRVKGTKVSLEGHTHDYLPMSGGTLRGSLTVPGTLYLPNASMSLSFGDDIRMGDGDVANNLVLQGGQNPQIAGITFGSGKDTNIYRGGANTLQTDDLFNAIGGLQWNGQSLDERYFARRWEVGNTIDWNSLIQPGCYKIQMSAWGPVSLHGPNQGYSYGLLMVYRTAVGSEDRIYQVYMPHRTDEPRWFRMCNASGWHDWAPQDVRASADNRYFTKYALRIKGVDINTYSIGGFYAVVHHEQACTNLPVASDGHLLVVPWSSGEWCSQIFINDVEGDMYIRTKTGSGINDWTAWAKVYDTRHKPTPAEIGAWSSADVSQANQPYKVVQRDNAGDVNCRLIRTSYQDENYMNGALAFRTNNSSDNYTRYCNSPAAVMQWLGATPLSSNSSISLHADADSSSEEEFLSLKAGNNDLRILSSAANQSTTALLFNGNQIYHTGKKPTPAEIGAVSTSGFTEVNGRINVGDKGKFLSLGVGDYDAAIQNTKSGKWLQLCDNGDLTYSGTRILRDIQRSPLWQGYHHMSGNETVTPSKALSDCNNGWVIVWSDWDDGSQGQNWNFCFTHIPKNTPWKNGQNHTFPLTAGEDSWAIKTLYIYNTYFKGNDTNKNGSNYDVVIRAVLEY